MIALPLALALGIASIPSGVATPWPPPALGIFTAILGGLIVSLLGGSRVQIAGPTAAFIPIILLVVTEHGFSGLVLATMMAGVILILLGVTRLGSLIKYIPWPVTSGFTTGIAVAIMITQVADFTGLRGTEPIPREFLEKVPWLMAHLSGANLATLAISLTCVGVIIFWPKIAPKWAGRFLPGSILAMLGATILVTAGGWGKTLGVATVGSTFGPEAIPSGIPGLAWPELKMATLRELIGPASAIALLGAIESLLSARGGRWAHGGSSR
jgi:SulP family sulfate permease